MALQDKLEGGQCQLWCHLLWTMWLSICQTLLPANLYLLPPRERRCKNPRTDSRGCWEINRAPVIFVPSITMSSWATSFAPPSLHLSCCAQFQIHPPIKAHHNPAARLHPGTLVPDP
eukprot:397655-Amphidinium_carterae.1